MLIKEGDRSGVCGGKVRSNGYRGSSVSAVRGMALTSCCSHHSVFSSFGRPSSDRLSFGAVPRQRRSQSRVH